MDLDIESVVYDLGIAVERTTEKELWALCPMHESRTGKPDQHPSWSINRTTFAHHCFSCGYSGTLNMLYEDVLGEVPDNLEWELARAGVQQALAPEVAPVTQGPTVNEWELHNYSAVPDRMLELRRLKRSAIDAFDIRWDRDRRAWVLPMRTPEGALLGFQYRQKGVFLNHPEGINKSSTLFGLSHQLDQRRMVIVESPLDAVRLYGLGIPAVSTMGAWVSATQAELLSQHFWMIVSGLDNDPAGQKGYQRLLTLLIRQTTVIVAWDYTGLPGKDPGDVEDDEELLAAWNRTITFGL